MIRYTLSLVFAVGLFLQAQTASAQVDDPPPPPPLGDVDEPPPPPSDNYPPSRRTRRSSKRKAAAAATDSDSPVVRANGEEGNMGLFFRFGGLATMTATGDQQKANATTLNTQLGLKFVMSESIMIPLFFGMGIAMNKTGADDSTSTGFSMDLGTGVEYHFRIWRRLSPFFGAIMKLGFYDALSSTSADPKADDLSIHFHIGPTIGVEYYIADRVSLAAAYMLMISLTAKNVNSDADSDPAITFDMTTKDGLDVAAKSGGYLTLCFYF